jgi:hypothetical protein
MGENCRVALDADVKELVGVKLRSDQSSRTSQPLVSTYNFASTLSNVQDAIGSFCPPQA